MNLFEFFILAVGLAMDAFAIAICAGLTMRKADLRKACTVGLYFGLFQAIMPLIGYITAIWFADMIAAYGHWVAFGLLSFLGGKMIIGSFRQNDKSEEETSLRPAKMLPLAFATSIDALAVGVSFAFLQVDIVMAAILIGAVTFALCISGVLIGKAFGVRLKTKAELFGGLILILIGVRILLEHLGDMLSEEQIEAMEAFIHAATAISLENIVITFK
jgi:putative Mn2+ efflux pump MntP